MDRKVRQVLEELIHKAFIRNVVGSPDRSVIETCVIQGKPIPEHLLPGRIILRLDAEDRQKLTYIKSKDLAGYRYPEASYTSKRLISGRAINLAGK